MNDTDTATWPPVRRPPVRLRRLAVLRVMLRPRAAARLLQDLAAEAAMRELACHVVIRACALWHDQR